MKGREQGYEASEYLPGYCFVYFGPEVAVYLVLPLLHESRDVESLEVCVATVAGLKLMAASEVPKR